MCDFIKRLFLVYIGGVTLQQEEIGQKVYNPCFLTGICATTFTD